MRTRFTWIVAILALVAVGVLVACSTKYSSSSNGLLVVPTQGAAVMQTFSIDLSNGHVSTINNVNGPPTNGLPTAVILDPPGKFAYVIVYANPAVNNSATGIETFSVASDGKLTAIGTTPLTNPVAIVMDSAGKFLFVANGSEGTVSVFSIGSNASLSEVPNSPFPLALPTGGQAPSASALAVTPTVYPELYAYCSGFSAPTTENLYVTDSVNYEILNYSVDPSGALNPKTVSATVPGVPTGTVPSGVTVDPCNRFAYVANAGVSNSVSAYTICSVVTQICPSADYSLHEVTGSPYVVGDAPGPLAVDAYASFLYVVDTGSSELSAFRISQSNGTLTPLTPPTVATNTGANSPNSGANSIAIRSDDSWLFVANINSATVSQYAIVPATGALTAQTPITTFNYPSGVAVK